jgi:hypothetical protein
MNDDSLNQAFLSLIQIFVERQQIVVEAMEEVCPRRLRMAGISREIASEAYWKEISSNKLRDQPQFGEWHGEWKYFWHGCGCRLKNLSTGEIIEWDAPDLQTFDKYWLSNWIAWAFTQQNHDESMSVVHSAAEASSVNPKNFIFMLLDHLRETGKIIQSSPRNFNKLALQK